MCLIQRENRQPSRFGCSERCEGPELVVLDIVNKNAFVRSCNANVEVSAKVLDRGDPRNTIVCASACYMSPAPTSSLLHVYLIPLLFLPLMSTLNTFLEYPFALAKGFTLSLRPIIDGEDLVPLPFPMLLSVWHSRLLPLAVVQLHLP